MTSSDVVDTAQALQMRDACDVIVADLERLTDAVRTRADQHKHTPMIGRDDWPALRQRVINADILIMATPIWLGQPSSVAKRVMERMDAFLRAL